MDCQDNMALDQFQISIYRKQDLIRYAGLTFEQRLFQHGLLISADDVPAGDDS
jgi:hypothetical protein